MASLSERRSGRSLFPLSKPRSVQTDHISSPSRRAAGHRGNSLHQAFLRTCPRFPCNVTRGPEQISKPCVSNCASRDLRGSSQGWKDVPPDPSTRSPFGGFEPLRFGALLQKSLRGTPSTGQPRCEDTSKHLSHSKTCQATTAIGFCDSRKSLVRYRPKGSAHQIPWRCSSHHKSTTSTFHQQLN